MTALTLNGVVIHIMYNNNNDDNDDNDDDNNNNIARVTRACYCLIMSYNNVLQ